MIRRFELEGPETTTPNMLLFSVSVNFTPNKNVKVVLHQSSGLRADARSSTPIAREAAAEIALRKRRFRVVMTYNAITVENSDEGQTHCRSEAAQVEPHDGPVIGLLGAPSWIVRFCVLFQVPLSRHGVPVGGSQHHEQQQRRRSNTTGDERIGAVEAVLSGKAKEGQGVRFQLRSLSLASITDSLIATATCELAQIQCLLVEEKLQVPLLPHIGAIGTLGLAIPVSLVVTRLDTHCIVDDTTCLALLSTVAPQPRPDTNSATAADVGDITKGTGTMVIKRRLSWMQRVKEQQTWLFNHQCCAFEMPVNGKYGNATGGGGGGHAGVTDEGRGGGESDKGRRTVCEHIFETDLTFKLPHRYLTLCLEQQARRLAEWKRLHEHARAAQLRFCNDVEAHEYGCAGVTVTVLACVDIQPTHRVDWTAPPAGAGVVASSSHSQSPPQLHSVVDRELTLVEDQFQIDLSSATAQNSSSVDGSFTPRVHLRSKSPSKAISSSSSSSTISPMKQTLGRRFRSRLDNFRSSAKATAQRVTTGELWRDRSAQSGLCSPFVTVVHSTSGGECETWATEFNVVSSSDSSVLVASDGNSGDERILGRTNTEYRTVNPRFMSNANKRMCEHSAPVQTFTASTNSTLVENMPSFHFYAKADKVSGKTGFLHLLVSHERFGLNKGVTTVPMMKALLPLDFFSCVSGNESPSCKGSTSSSSNTNGYIEKKLSLHPLSARAEQLMDGSAAVLGYLHVRVAVSLPNAPQRRRQPPPPPPLPPAATGTFIHLGNRIDNKNNNNSPIVVDMKAKTKETKILERSNWYLRSWDLDGMVALMNTINVDMVLLQKSISTCEAGLCGKEPAIPGSPVAKLRARQEEQRKARVEQGGEDSTCPCSTDICDTRVMFKASQYKKEARAAGVPTNLHVSLYTIEVQKEQRDNKGSVALSPSSAAACRVTYGGGSGGGDDDAAAAADDDDDDDDGNSDASVKRIPPPPIPPRPSLTGGGSGGVYPQEHLQQPIEHQHQQKEVEVFGGVTCGVPSAHFLGLTSKSTITAMQDSYNGIRSEVLSSWSPLDPNRNLQLMQHQQQPDNAPSTHPGNATGAADAQLQLALAGQSLATREALVFSQGIPIVSSTLLMEIFIRATGKTNRYSAAVDISTWGQQILGCGWLFGMESLVSAHGKELSMLLDNTAFIEWLTRCRVKLVPDTTLPPDKCNKSSNNPFENLIPCDDTPANDDQSAPHTMPPWSVAIHILDYEREAKAHNSNIEGEDIQAAAAAAVGAASRGTPLVENGAAGVLERVGAAAVEICIGVPHEILVAMGFVDSLSSSSNSNSIRILPVLFTQGINEMQSVANLKSRLKSTLRDVQRDLNSHSQISVKAYSRRVSLMLANRRANALPNSQTQINMGRYLHSITDAVVDLEKVVASQQNHLKDTDVLTSAEEAIRALNGGLVTFCKSGKDRTAMAVTLAQARLLLASNAGAEHTDGIDGHDGVGVGGDVFSQTFCESKGQGAGGGRSSGSFVRSHAHETARLLEVASVFREFGCRMVVAEKNIGRPQYSFNAVQRKLLPQLYRPPVSTIQDLITSVVSRDS